MQKLYGYVRVSTREQCEDRQLIALSRLSIPSGQIYIDRQSGRDFNRPAYRKMMRQIRPGDTIFVKSIDRLGRSYEDIQEQWRMITREKKADIVVLDMPLLDTRISQNGLTGVCIAELVLQILSYVAQTERENTLARQKEGIAAAKLRGVRFGRPPKPRPEAFSDLLFLWQEGNISSREAAEQLGVSQSTFLRWANGGSKEKLNNESRENIF